MSLTRQQKRAQAAKLKKSVKTGVTPEQFQTAISAAVAHHQKGEIDQALELYNKLAKFAPKDPIIKHLTGVVHYQKGNFETAIKLIKAAIEINPDDAAYYNNLGNALCGLRQFDEAVWAYEEAVSIKEGDYPEAINNMGAALHEIGNWRKELEYYKQSLDRHPYDYNLLNETVKTMKDACDWENLDEYTQRLVSGTKQALEHNVLPALTPYHSLTLDIDPNFKKKIAQNYAALRYGNTQPKFKTYNTPGDKIKVGYVSADYRDHPTAHLISGLFKHHNRDNFEIYAYSYGKDDKSEHRQQIMDNCDYFVDLVNKNPEQIAKRINKDNIDILVDVMGYIQNAFPSIYAMRPAPVQISYLAYPGTMGAPFIDYLITDHIAVPKADEDSYTEDLLFMPNSYFVTDDKQEIAKPPTRAECGLPTDKFVFCSFNKSSKIDPKTFACWMDILKQVEDSVLWLFVPNEFTQENLTKEAQKHDIDPQRLIFASRLDKAEHLARHACADLFLDCFTVCAHTTAIDSLYAGLPLITKAGNDIMSRASASILTAIDLPEMITNNQEDFIQLAIKYATDEKALNQLKQKLANNISSTALFDTKNYVQNLEQLYLQATNNL